MAEQLSLFGEPPTPARARRTDPATSHAAARRVTTKAQSVRAHVADLLRAAWPDGLTHDQIIGRYRRTIDPHVRESTVRTRVSELVEAGEVEAAGTVTTSGTTRALTLWRART